MSVSVWEAMCSGRNSGWMMLHGLALRIPIEWLVRILVLISMMLQLLLVVLGARRYLTSSGILCFIVWGAYISADAVAICALGTMMHSAQIEMYGIWAPVLLMHLGGPDAITAYSMADNELWMRHGFNMIYQVSVAVYVIYASVLEGRRLAAAILLLIVGFLKYGERTLALRSGSFPRIVMSSLPISKYMETKESRTENGCKYVVMGENKLERMIEQQKPISSSGERKRQGNIVTVDDVERADKKLVTDIGFELCLSHALFKMYKRRFGSLYFVEGDHKWTRTFWFERIEKRSGEQRKENSKECVRGVRSFRIVEMELKFMYDAVFSKYSNAGFSRWGMAVRFLNTALMGTAGFLILGGRASRHAQRMVTYILISVAFVVEVFQICRVILSDWTRVQLICAYVGAASEPRCGFQLIKNTMVAVGTFQDFVRRNKCLNKISGGNVYWSNQIPQHCLIDTWLNTSPMMCKIAGCFPKPERSVARGAIVNWYAEIRHVKKVPVEDDLKEFIFLILEKACSGEYESDQCRKNIYNYEKDLFEKETEIGEVFKSHGNLEEVILIWHIATTLCDRERGVQNEALDEDHKKYVNFSRVLSKYCAYLLLSHPNLLPLHPKMARIVYMQVVNQLLDTLTLGSIIQKNPRDLLDSSKNDVLGSAAKLTNQLLEKGGAQLWRLLAEHWGKLLIYMAVYNKAIFHVERMAAGGEFLSLVWVLVSHMGCGEQSDSAVTKKIEMMSDKVLVGNSTAHEKELAATMKELKDRENELAATKKELKDSENELAATKKELKDRENELASSRHKEELATTRKILRERS